MLHANQHHDAKRLGRDSYTQRVAQYAALFELRKIKSEGVDDSQYLHALTYVDLGSEQFVDIASADIDRLHRITAALKSIVQQSAVPDAKMNSALTAQQYAQYLSSFDLDISHIEVDEQGSMPWQLVGYLGMLSKGDGYTRTANMFKRSKKRDAQGRTAFGRYESKAFGCYEEAVMDLCSYVDTDKQRNPNPDPQLAGEILRWLDRDVNPEPGCAPDISAAGVPRIRGIKSKYSLIDSAPVVGVRLRKHWRQREALAKAALELIYEEVEEDVLTDEQQQKMRDKLSDMMKIINPERD